LGIHFDVDISKITKINYEKYLKKMKGLFKQWNNRNLTPIQNYWCIISKLRNFMFWVQDFNSFYILGFSLIFIAIISAHSMNK
jgi:hypothetical protein